MPPTYADIKVVEYVYFTETIFEQVQKTPENTLVQTCQHCEMENRDIFLPNPKIVKKIATGQRVAEVIEGNGDEPEPRTEERPRMEEMLCVNTVTVTHSDEDEMALAHQEITQVFEEVTTHHRQLGDAPPTKWKWHEIPSGVFGYKPKTGDPDNTRKGS